MAPLSQLNPDQVAFFREKGYLHLPHGEHDLVDDVTELQKWVAEIFDWGPEKGKWRLYYETSMTGKHQLWGTERIIEYHNSMRQLLSGEKAFSLVEALTGRRMLLFKDEMSWKLPGGKGAVPHIDRPAYSHMAPEFLEIMIAVDPHIPENGCLEFVPGSPSMHVPVSEDGRIDQSWASTHDFIPMILSPGDILIFNERMAHRLAPNLTDQRRAAVFGTYHFDLSQPDLREKFYAHRLVHNPPENV